MTPEEIKTQWETIRPYLSTLSEIGLGLGVTRATTSNWGTRHDDFPKPLQGSSSHTKRGGLYVRSEVLQWVKQHNEKVSRMRKENNKRKPEEIEAIKQMIQEELNNL